MSGALPVAPTVEACSRADGWPYPDVHDDAKAGRDVWREISHERADEFLDVLPPIYFPGGFAVSEESDFWNGEPTYGVVTRCGRRYFMRELGRSRFVVEVLRLRQALGASV